LPKGLSALIAPGASGKPVTLSVPSQRGVDSGKTNRHGIEETSTTELNSFGLRNLSKRGGLLSIEATVGQQKTTQRVLALPKDNDGPIFVSDIDDTLRDANIGAVLEGKTQKPIDGAQTLLKRRRRPRCSRGVLVGWTTASGSGE
jgi:hypothetical protein